MTYVDNFIFAIPKASLEAYKEDARTSATVWKELGALSYQEALADDAPFGERTSFPRAVELTDDEVVVVSIITYKDKAARDDISRRAMEDPRMVKVMHHADELKIDMGRMVFGGFETFVES